MRNKHREARYMSRAKGFTIVELLIVIVVIGILAAITVVSYSGIQLRARVVSVQADLGNLNKQMELFKIENDTYPATATDVEKVLRSARLYENTRLSAADEAAGKQPSRSFIFCMKKNTQSFAIVSFAPISTFLVANGASHVGEPLYYVSSEFSGTKTLQWDASLNTGSNLCTSVSPTYNVLNDRYIVWSFSVPTPNAP